MLLVDESVQQSRAWWRRPFSDLRAIPKEYFRKEFRKLRFLLNESPDRLQYSLEVVLLRPSADEQPEVSVDLALDVKAAFDILLVLGAVEVHVKHPKCTLQSCVSDHPTFVHLGLHFSASDRLDAEFLAEHAARPVLLDLVDKLLVDRLGP